MVAAAFSSRQALLRGSYALLMMCAVLIFPFFFSFFSPGSGSCPQVWVWLPRPNCIRRCVELESLIRLLVSFHFFSVGRNHICFFIHFFFSCTAAFCFLFLPNHSSLYSSCTPIYLYTKIGLHFLRFPALYSYPFFFFVYLENNESAVTVYTKKGAVFSSSFQLYLYNLPFLVT